jgi:hypothetical protein
MLVDRFGIFEAAASATIKLVRLDESGEVELPMEKVVAEAAMEFGSDLRTAFHAARTPRPEFGCEPEETGARHVPRRRGSRPRPPRPTACYVASKRVEPRIGGRERMPLTISQIEAEARALPPEEGADLAQKLLATREDGGDLEPAHQVEQAWIEEAERRYQWYVTGQTQSTPAREELGGYIVDESRRSTGARAKKILSLSV